MVLLGLVSQNPQTDSATKAFVSILLAIAKRHLVSDVAQAGHLVCRLLLEKKNHTAAQGNGFARFHEEATGADVAPYPHGNSIRRGEVNGEDLVKAEASAALRQSVPPL